MKIFNLKVASVVLGFILIAAQNGNCREQNEKSLEFSIMESVVAYLDKSVISYSNTIEGVTDFTDFPSSVDSDGNLKTVEASNWVSGFFPGCLWYLYEYTLDNKFKTAAQNWTEALVDEQFNGTTSDLGFKMYNTYGNGYRLTSNNNYKDVLLQSAITSNTRFNETVGCIESWNWENGYSVIIDNMMNLELLTWAASNGGSAELYTSAISHADRTLQNHFREDHSSHHVVVYNESDGTINRKVTSQGYSNESAWARGQAWGFYGFTMMFRETGKQEYLNLAIDIADYLIGRLPVDFIPFYDFDAPNIPNEPRDASAAAIIASALLELYQYVPEKSADYLNIAEEILKELMSPSYFAEPGTNSNFLLKHSTGFWQLSETVDVPMIYAEYYFIEALLRYFHAGITLQNSLPDVDLMEDGEDYIVSQDLMTFYGLQDEDNIEIKSFSNQAQLTATISDNNKLTISYPENFNGSAKITVEISRDGQVVSDEFLVNVVAQNDPPTPVSLISPVHNLVLDSYGIQFDWTESTDIDGDDVKYSLALRGTVLDTVITNITESGFLFDGSGILESNNSYIWSIITTDGSVQFESEIFTFFTSNSLNSVENRKVNCLEIYPNPFKDKLYLEFDVDVGINQNVELAVYNLLGQMIYSETIQVLPMVKMRRMINLETELAGLYFVRLKLNGESFSNLVLKL